MQTENSAKFISSGKWYSEFDEDGNVVRAVYDSSFHALLGFIPEEYTDAQDTWINSIHPDDLERVEAHLAEVLKCHPEGMDYDIEYRMKTKFGYHWFHDYGHCTRREDGSAARCDGVVFDIQDAVDKENSHRLFALNNERILALEDKFESLYDVELDTGRYEIFIKGETYNKEIKNRLLNVNEYFADLNENIDLVVYPDDREKVREGLAKETVCRELATKPYYDFYYRLLINDEPVWFKVRIVYKDAEKKNIIIGVFNAEDEVRIRGREEHLRSELINQMIGDDGLFLIDCAANTRKTIHDKTLGSELFSDRESFTDAMTRYINRYVVESDRRKMLEISSPEYMLKRTAEEKEYSVRYRDLTTGIQRFYEMRIMRFSDTEVLQSFKEKDKETVERMVFDKIEEDYFALFSVDLDTGLAAVMKNDYGYLVKEGCITSFSPMMKTMAADFESETSEFLERISSIEYLKKRFIKDDKETYAYRSHLGGKAQWGLITELVLTRNEDGTPSIFALGFSLLDDKASEKEELQAKINEAMNVVGGLASEYTALYHVDLDSGLFRNYQATDRIADVRENFDRFPLFYDLYRDYVAGEAVHPDSKKQLKAFYAGNDALREALRGKKKISTLYLRKYGTEYLWTEMTVVKCENIDEEAHTVIFGFVEKDEEVKLELEAQKQRKEAEEVNKLVDTLVSACKVAFRVNLADDSCKRLRKNDSLPEEGREYSCFDEVKTFLCTKIVHPADRKRMKKVLDYSVIRKKLARTRSYSVEYRALNRGVTIWNEMTVTSIGDDEVVIGFTEKNLDIIKRHLAEMAYDEYLALFIVDLDTEMIQPVKTSGLFKTAKVGEAVSYAEAMRTFASIYQGEAREFLNRISDIEYVRREFAYDDKRTFAYKAAKLDGDRWIDVICYVTQRHEDGRPSMFTLGFSLVDSLATARQELQARIREDMQMIGGLASEYHALYYLNIAERMFKVYSFDESRFPEATAMIDDNENPDVAFARFVSSDLVHPDDRSLFTGLTLENLVDRLNHIKKFTVRFRQNYGSEYLWTEMDVVKYEAVDEPANVIAVGFAERDAEIRSEQTLNRCFEVLGSEISPEKAIEELLLHTGEFYGAERAYIFEFGQNKEVINNTYEWCADGVTAMIDKLQEVPAHEVDGWIREFNLRGAFCMDSLDERSYSTPEGRELLEMQGITSLIAAPILNGSEIVGFIGVDNPTLARTNSYVLKNIAVVVYSEILKGRQTQMALYESAKIFSDTFLNSYVSAYYINLSDCSQTVFHRDQFIQDTYGHISNYLESITKYINECVHPDDRTAMLVAVQPQYIRRRLKKESSYSIYMRDMSGESIRWYRFDITRGSDVNHAGLAFSDVTEKLAEENRNAKQLRDALEAADVANRSKTSFLFNMSHDIRTPMNAITGFTAMAKKHIDDTEKVTDYLN